MLSGVLDVAEMQVRDIMVPRLAHGGSWSATPSPEALLPVIIESGHSRYPVIGEDRDEIVGILLAKDLLRYFANRERSSPSATTCAPGLVPESKRLNVMLRDFRASHNHMAIVVDEYGGVSGLVTIEDVIEQIVGEIDDEHDVEEDTFIHAESESRFIVKALTPIEDFNEYFGTQFSDEATTPSVASLHARAGTPAPPRRSARL
jgi:magnesium and cobalt transporter